MELAAYKPTDSEPQASRKPTARSRVSNGRDILPNVDGRSLIARRYRDIASAVVVDQGGFDQCLAVGEPRLHLLRDAGGGGEAPDQLQTAFRAPVRSRAATLARPAATASNLSTAVRTGSPRSRRRRSRAGREVRTKSRWTARGLKISTSGFQKRGAFAARSERERRNEQQTSPGRRRSSRSRPPIRFARKLAAAIEAATTARADLAGHDAALTRGRELVTAAEAALERATANVDEVRDRHGAELAAAIGDGAPLPASRTVQAALAAEADARIALEQAAAGLGRLRADRPDREVAVTEADLAVLRAAALHRGSFSRTVRRLDLLLDPLD
jgi:hypothetical protein